MAIERKPVPGAKLPPPLRCKDFDPVTGKRIGFDCENEQKAHGAGRFDCTNRGTGKCNRRTFLYPRKRNEKGDFHTHQGIDFYPKEDKEKAGEAPKDVPIISVTSGEVCCVLEWDGKSSGYGNVIAVYDRTHDRTFWYAHCKKVLFREHEVVREQQQIAIVGNTGNAGDPHLHFEVHGGRSEAPPFLERTLFSAAGVRLGPRDVLESLGPWGVTQVYFPRGDKVGEDEVRDLHAEVESSRKGGCFPLGANNLWHGGVHVRMPSGADLHAPFDGHVVAVRLDPDPAQAIQRYGSTNFVLLRHQIVDSVFERLQSGTRPSEPPPPPKRPPAVGPRGSNDPDDVVAVKQALHERGFYDPEPTSKLDDGSTVDAELQAAIKAFQSTLDNPYRTRPERWPDGTITVGGYTWRALFPPDPSSPDDPHAPEVPSLPPLDPTRTVYSLFMHVGAVSLDRRLAERVKWLRRALLPGTTPTPVPDDDPEHLADVEEGQRTLTGAVGRSKKDPSATGTLADIEWVQRRLRRHTDYDFDEATQAGVFDDALDLAIRTFQETYVPHFVDRGRPGDGVVGKDGPTYSRLATPERDLQPGSSSGIDPAFRARLEERGPDGMTRVVSGLSIPVAGNDVLWTAGEAQVMRPDGSTSMESLVHWEIFSEHQLVASWEAAVLRDETDDLTLDVPERIFDAVELLDLPGFARDDFITPLEMAEFYASERALFLRRTPCRFHSEWGANITATLIGMEVMGVDITGVAEALAPMMWWNDATDVLPASPLVWHYNPVEFLGLYQEHLDALRPKEVDPTIHGTLVVRVLFDNGVRRPKADVFVRREGTAADADRTAEDGEAWFRGLLPGDYTVVVDRSSVASHPVAVAIGSPTLLEVTTTVVGPPPPHGTIDVIVRRHTVTIAGDDIDVSLTSALDGAVLRGRTRKGKVRFGSVRYGEHSVTAGLAPPTELELARSKKTVTIVLPRPIRPLRVWLRIDGAPAVGYSMEARQKTKTLATVITDHDGRASFMLPVGRYKVWVGEHRKSVLVSEDEEYRYTLELTEEDSETLEHGTLAVQVRAGGEPVRDEYVAVLDAAGGFVDGQSTDEHGAALFELPPGEYLVKAADQSSSWRLGNHQITVAELELDSPNE